MHRRRQSAPRHPAEAEAPLPGYPAPRAAPPASVRCRQRKLQPSLGPCSGVVPPLRRERFVQVLHGQPKQCPPRRPWRPDTHATLVMHPAPPFGRKLRPPPPIALGRARRQTSGLADCRTNPCARESADPAANHRLPRRPNFRQAQPQRAHRRERLAATHSVCVGQAGSTGREDLRHPQRHSRLQVSGAHFRFARAPRSLAHEPGRAAKLPPQKRR